MNSLALNSSSTATITLRAPTGRPLQFAGANPQLIQNGAGNVLFSSSSGTQGAIFNVVNPFTIGGAGAGTVTIGGDTDNTVFSGTADVTVNFSNVGTAAAPNLRLGNVPSWNGNLRVDSGYVIANRTGGDLIGAITILNVGANGAFDFNNNGEVFGGISGSGKIVAGSAGQTWNAPSSQVWNGSISGTGAVNIEPGIAFTYTFGGSNDYSGATNVRSSNLVINSNGQLSGTTNLFALRSTITLDNTGVNLANRVNDASPVNLTNGELVLLGAANASTIETVGGLTSNFGPGIVRVVPGTGGSAELTFNSLATRTAAGATLSLEGTGSVRVLTAPTNVNGILGGHVVRGSDFVASDGTGGLVTPVYETSTNPADYSSEKNVKPAGVVAGSLGNVAVNSLNLGTAQTLALGGGNLTVTSGGVLVNANVTLSDGAVVSGLDAGSGGDLIVNVTNGNTLTVAATGGFGSSPLTKAGEGTLDLTAVNTTSTAATFLNGGTTIVNANSNLGTGALTIQGGTLRAAADIAFPASRTVSFGGRLSEFDTGVYNVSIAGVVNATGNFRKTGVGTLTLSGTNTFDGSILLEQGALSIGTPANLGVNAASVYFNGGTLQITGDYNAADNQPFFIGPGGGTIEVANAFTAVKQGRAFFGTGTLTKTGGGTFSVGSNPSSFTGATNVQGGTLRFTSNQFRNAATVTVANGARYEIRDDAANGNFNFGIGARLVLNGDGPDGGGAFLLVDPSATLTGGPNTNFNSPIELASNTSVGAVNNSAPDSTRISTLILNQPVSGNGGLTKLGNGVLRLNAANSYTGGTTVTAGTLVVNNPVASPSASGTGSGAVTVTGGTLGGNGSIAGPLTITSGTLAPGTGVGDLATGDLALSAAATVAIEIGGSAPGTGYDQLLTNGTVALGGAQLTASLLSGFTPGDGQAFVILANDGVDAIGGQFAQQSSLTISGVPFKISYDGGDGNDVALVAAVPEPSTIGAASMLIGGLLARRRRRS